MGVWGGNTSIFMKGGGSLSLDENNAYTSLVRTLGHRLADAILLPWLTSIQAPGCANGVRGKLNPHVASSPRGLGV